MLFDGTSFGLFLISQILVLLLPVPGGSGELFTAISHLKGLVDVEKQLAVYLKHFIKDEEIRLERIAVHYNKSRHLLELDVSSELGISEYVGHPINSLLTVERLLLVGSELETLIGIDFTKELVKKLQKYKQLFPSDVDVKGALNALLRIQNTYNLPPATISDGIVPNVSSVSHMSASDAFDIGQEAYSEEDFRETEMWMKETLRLMKIGRVIGEGPAKFDVLDHLAWSEYSNGKFEAAIKHTTEMLLVDPSNERLSRNIELYQQHYWKKKTAEMKMTRENKKSPKKISKSKKQGKFYYTKDEDDYRRYLIEKVRAKKLCRGETMPVPKKHLSKMKCWYKTSHPLLVLKPGRVERIYSKPDIFLFRGVLGETELRRIQKTATPLLNRATVHNPTTGEIEVATYRISKSAWLDSRNDPVIGKVDIRVEALTGLSLETAESLQVANYGMGGHYETHFDFAQTTPIRPPPFQRNLTSELTFRSENETKALLIEENGDRIATFLIYMSDVEMGGGTVFTNIRQQIRPSKGDALFWYNLNDDGTGDYNTRHAACPVLIGEKWVANKWIHERGQEFRRLCPLKRYSTDDT